MSFRRIVHVAVPLAALFFAACTNSGDPADAGPQVGNCTTPFAGDPNAEPQVELLAMGVDNEVTVLTDNSTLPLMFPPQAGRVAFVGVRALNVDPCALELSGVMSDPVSNRITLDRRTVSLRPTDGGTVASGRGVVNTWANIPLCPNQWSNEDVYGNEYPLTVTLKQRSGRTFERTINVTPYCAEPDRLEDCRCICRGGYMLGEVCVFDGGVGAADGGVPDGGAVDGGP